MRFSVVIPCHNVAPYIQQALRSVAGQTLAAHEIIVLDDASTDDTVERIEAGGAGVRLLRVTHRNAAATRNDGIDAATGDWVAFLDADDLWDADHLERIATLVEGGNDGAYLCRGKRINEGGDGQTRQVSEPWPWAEPRTGLESEALLDAKLRGKVSTGTPFTAASTKVLRHVGMFNPAQRYRHDLELWLRLARHTSWTLDPHPSVAFRYERPGGISSHFPSIYRYELRAYERNQEGYDPELLDAIRRRLARHVMVRAFTDGTRRDRRRAWAVARPWLRQRDRFGFALASSSPRLNGWLLRQVRAIKNGGYVK